jgi:hypothetical protein
MKVTPKQRELHPPPQVSGAKDKSRASDSNAKDKRQLDKAGIFLTSFAVGLAFLFLGFELVSHYSTVDDAYISFRYLDNWLNG